MYDLGKRTNINKSINEEKSLGECFMGCIVVCNSMCGCTGAKAAYTADAVDAGVHTTVYGRNTVNV